MTLTDAQWSLVLALRPRVRAVASRWAARDRDIDEIESAVQWALIRAASETTGDDPSDFAERAERAMERAAWSAVTTYRPCLSLDGIMARRISWDIEAAPTTEGYLAAEDVDGFDRRTRDLPEAERMALRLRFVHGLTPSDAASAMGVSVSTYQNRVAVGLMRVRAAIEGRTTGGHSGVWSQRMRSTG